MGLSLTALSFALGTSITAAAPAAAVIPATETTPAAGTTPATPPPPVIEDCVDGTWTTPTVDMYDEQYHTEHLSFRWETGDTSVDQEEVETAGEWLEYVWDVYITQTGFPEPYCDSTTKYRVNIELDSSYGYSGGSTGSGHMAMWMPSDGLDNRWVDAHELTHAMQSQTAYGRIRNSYTGTLLETHANWMAHQVPELNDDFHCSELFVNNTSMYMGSERDYYCNWQLLEYIKNRFGYSAVQDVWRNAPTDPAETAELDWPMIFADNMGWTNAEFDDFLAEWAMHNVTWDYVDPDGTDRSADFQEAYGPITDTTGTRIHRLARLNPVEGIDGRYTVQHEQAPQQGGYNTVKLNPTPGSSSMTVGFRGIVQDEPGTNSLPELSSMEPPTIPDPTSGWRWGVVTVDSTGRPHYSAIQKEATGTLTVPVSPDNQGYYLVVLGAPAEHKLHVTGIWESQPYYSVYRYPYTVDLEGATPDALPRTDGQVWPNGGGWVSNAASVEPTVYVGPQAQVLGGTISDHVRIEDQAVVRSGTISGNAVIKGVTAIASEADGGEIVVEGDVVVDSVLEEIGTYATDIHLSGTTQLHGYAELAATDLSKGVYYDDVGISNASPDGAFGELTEPVDEVTAIPTLEELQADPPVVAPPTPTSTPVPTATPTATPSERPTSTSEPAPGASAEGEDSLALTGASDAGAPLIGALAAVTALLAGAALMAGRRMRR